MVFGVYMHAVEVVFSRIFSQFPLIRRICAQQRSRAKEEEKIRWKFFAPRKREKMERTENSKLTRALFSLLLFDDKNEILIPSIPYLTTIRECNKESREWFSLHPTSPHTVQHTAIDFLSSNKKKREECEWTKLLNWILTIKEISHFNFLLTYLSRSIPRCG